MSLKRKIKKKTKQPDNAGKEKTLKNIYFVTLLLGNALEILAYAGEQTAVIYCNTEIKNQEEINLSHVINVHKES